MKRENYRRHTTALIALLIMVILGAGCKQNATPAYEGDPGQAAAESKVTKIVFVGKEAACDCTRKRVDDSFAALQSGLADRRDILVERIAVDIDQVEVAQLHRKRPVMVLPGIYLLNESGGLVDMLQGEVTAKQIQDAIR